MSTGRDEDLLIESSRIFRPLPGGGHHLRHCWPVRNGGWTNIDFAIGNRHALVFSLRVQLSGRHVGGVSDAEGVVKDG